MEDAYNQSVSDKEILEFLSRRADIRELVYQKMLEEKRKNPKQNKRDKSDEIAEKNQKWMREEKERNGVEPSFF